SGLRYAGQSASRFVNLSRPARNAAPPSANRSAHHGAVRRLVSILSLLSMRVGKAEKVTATAVATKRKPGDSNVDMSLKVEAPGGLAFSTLPDSEIVRRVRAGDRALFEILMRRHNQRIYRAARAIIRDEAEVEDVMQQAYINAFTHLHQFEDRSQFSTWLTRIAVNEAIGRRQKRAAAASANQSLDEAHGHIMESITSSQPSPEH